MYNLTKRFRNIFNQYEFNFDNPGKTEVLNAADIVSMMKHIIKPDDISYIIKLNEFIHILLVVINEFNDITNIDGSTLRQIYNDSILPTLDYLDIEYGGEKQYLTKELSSTETKSNPVSIESYVPRKLFENLKNTSKRLYSVYQVLDNNYTVDNERWRDEVNDIISMILIYDSHQDANIKFIAGTILQTANLLLITLNKEKQTPNSAVFIDKITRDALERNFKFIEGYEYVEN